MAREVPLVAGQHAPPQVAMGVAMPSAAATGPEVVSAAYAILNQHERMQLRQQRQWIEALTGFERNNRYVLRDTQGNDIFFVRENSTCIERNFCKGACKAWRMDVYLLGPQGIQGGEASMTPFIHMERPCTLTCFCMNRPEVLISELGSGRLLGSIFEPFAWCNLQFEVRDPANQPVLITDIACCQWGLCCPCPCDGAPCNELAFPVTDIGSGQPVAEVLKKWMWGDCVQCMGEWDNYWIKFGSASNPDYKVLLVALSIFIQMRFFDRRNQKN